MVEDHTVNEIEDALKGPYKEGTINVWRFPLHKGYTMQAKIYEEIDLGVVHFSQSYWFINLSTGLRLFEMSDQYCFENVVHQFLTEFMSNPCSLDLLASRRNELIELRSYMQANKTKDRLFSKATCSFVNDFPDVLDTGFLLDIFANPEADENFG